MVSIIDYNNQFFYPEKKMIENILQFNDTTVKEVMTPRTRMFMLESKTPLSKVRKQLIKLPFSRIPVYDKDEDNIVGIMHMKTALTELMKKSTKKTASYKMMPVIFVPETRKINTLFHEFQEKHIHIAIVVGEHGGAKGLVTLEDLLEEIVGEIVDETDIARVMIRRLNKNTWIADGEAELEEINKKIGLSLNHDSFTTLAGWILSYLDRVPKEKEKVKYKKTTFIITKCDKTSVQKVKILR